MFKISEAQVGIGNEVAHINLIIGDKQTLASSFTQSFSKASQGFVSSIATLRPNLPSKPFVLLIPKTEISSNNKLFYGALQASISKAVLDSIEEKIFPEGLDLENTLIICKAYLSNNAVDERRVYHFNYSAMKLALKRAFLDYPSLDKVLYEKDRAINPILGYRVPRIWNTPYLQIALDTDSFENVKKILSQVPDSDRIILEVGTPLVKAEGVSVISKLRELAPDKLIVADLKTMDVSQVEVDMAFNQTADAVALAGVAPKDSVEKGIAECRRLGIYSIFDTINLKDPLQTLSDLKILPDIVIIHRGIDTEANTQSRWDLIPQIKELFKQKGQKVFIAVAGGIDSRNARQAIELGADIIVVGRYITQSKDIQRSVREFTSQLGLDIDHKRVHII